MIAAVFPGQGSQFVGMGKFLYNNFSFTKELFEQASEAISVDLKKLCFDGPESDLKLTENTQPCLVLASVVTYEVLKREFDFKPQTGAGHSVGEYSAMVCSGTINLEQAIQACRFRGQYMQQAVSVGKGGMLAIMGLSDNQVKQLCSWAEQESGLSPLEPANFNAPGQVVASGSQKLIDWLRKNFVAEKVFQEPPKKVRFIPLKVSAPFHCSLMKPAEEKMREVLDKVPFTTPDWPIVQNVSAEAVTDTELLKQNLIAQITAPVLWVQCTKKMQSLGAAKMLECGPGKVLSGLAKKIDSEGLHTLNVNNLDELKSFAESLGK